MREPDVGDRIELVYLPGCYGRILKKELVHNDDDYREPWTAYTATCGEPVRDVISLQRSEFKTPDAVGALGAVANELSVYISVEYGYVSVEWCYPGTLHDLFTDYAAGLTPFSRGGEKARGYYIENSPKNMRDYQVVIHIDEADDSSIAFGEWKVVPDWHPTKTTFVPLIKLHGLPGCARYDVVTALAVAALEVPP
jgi:hypothetical protein